VSGERILWTITNEQAAEMYARFCRARYGARAKRVAEQKIEELRNRGDAEGERAWSLVTRKIELQSPN
jgi:hypothetical protein